jgi:hypothetical protein
MRNRHLLPGILGILLSLFVVAAFIVPGAAQAQDKTSKTIPPHNAKPSGKVRLTLGQAGLLLSASGGHGTLVFQNKTYAFELGGIGLGEFGGAKANCVGDVFNLSRVEDFSGAYVQLKSGYTGTEGKDKIWLQNSNGVEIWLRSKTKGLELTAEVEGVEIKLKGVKKK